MALDDKKRDFKVVGKRVPRPDGVDKVTGRALYGADLSAPGMLVGQILRSPHAYAKIRSIDVTKAEAMPPSPGRTRSIAGHPSTFGSQWTR